jgi:hypothetical protein
MHEFEMTGFIDAKPLIRPSHEGARGWSDGEGLGGGACLWQQEERTR